MKIAPLSWFLSRGFYVEHRANAGAGMWGVLVTWGTTARRFSPQPLLSEHYEEVTREQEDQCLSRG